MEKVELIPYWKMTPKRFLAEEARRIRREYPHATVAEAEAMAEWHLDEFYTALEDAARRGERIPNRVLDALPAWKRNWILRQAFLDHTHLYHGYVLPERRQG